MILLLDAGNSRLKWGLLLEGRSIARGVLDYPQLDELPLAWRAYGAPVQALGANVAGAAVAARIGAVLGPGIELHWNAAQPRQSGVCNGYAEPARLGADRWAALIGARAQHRGAALVVMAGTATTVDLLLEDGHFAGGLILPGFDLMRRPLAGNTAQLPYADGRYREFPGTTADAIFTGCSDAQAGAIERCFKRIAAAPDPLCLVSGGAAAVIAARLELPLRQADNLVLDGLAQIAADRANMR